MPEQPDAQESSAAPELPGGPELREALAVLARTPSLLVALDFDGTLAPLVDDPAEARALPRAREAMLALLDLPATRVALISGRAMASLVHVSGLPETVLLSGSHGVEVRLDAEPSITLNAAEFERIAALKAALETIASGYDKVWIEDKPAGFAMHTRLASDPDAQAAYRDALTAVEPIGDLTTRRGSDVLEFSVRSTHKGDAVRRLREYSGASAVFFAGDDVTDEDAFAELAPGDLGLKCGPGLTAAGFRVQTPDDVAEVLSELARMRYHEISA